MRGCKLLSSSLPLPSLFPPLLLPCFRLSTVGHGSFYTLIFCKLYLIALLFPETWKKLLHKLTYTRTNTHIHTRTHKSHNYLVARFAAGPRTTMSKLSWKDCHDNAERMDTKKKGRVEGRMKTSVKTCDSSSRTSVDQTRAGLETNGVQVYLGRQKMFLGQKEIYPFPSGPKGFFYVFISVSITTALHIIS